MEFTVFPAEMRAKTTLETVPVAEGIADLHVTFDFGAPTRPDMVKVAWEFSMREMLSVWMPMAKFDRSVGVNWKKRRAVSRQSMGAPVLACIDPQGKSLLTVGVSDAKTPLEICCGVSEETATQECNVNFFTAPIAPITVYRAVIRLDTRYLPFTETVQDIAAWWERDCVYPRAAVPAAAYRPMNSAWYSFHQELDPDRLVHECERSATYGLDTIIIDDGWQTDNNNRGYAYCGDWELCRSKIPDMADLVRRIHQTGMRVMLWFGVPFIGIYAKAYDRFKDKALYHRQKDFVIDVRYPEVRQYLIDIYARAVREWDLDGLKLDFVDTFFLDKTSPDFREGMDYTSVEDAVERLFRDISKTLAAIKKDLLFEFRQNYIGPSILQCGNMIRVGDCPYNALQNRMAIVDLRLTSGETAVHSDMLMWHPADTVESACMQILATVFGVPQISVLLDRIPTDHQRALRYWMQFCRENEKVLQRGKLSVKNPEQCYTQVCSENEQTAVTANYAAVPFRVGAQATQIFINAAYDPLSTLFFDGRSGRYQAEIRNCMGDVVDTLTLDAACGTAALPIPPCGMVTLSKI